MDENYANGAPPPPPNGQEQGGYCIEIYVGPGNQVQSIKVEQKSAEPMEDDEGMEPSIPVQDIKQALHIAMKVYKSGGQMGEGMEQEPPEGQEMDDLMEGYGKGSYAAQQQGMPVGKVFKGNM